MKDNRTSMRIQPSYMKIIDELRELVSSDISRVDLINGYLEDVIEGRYDDLPTPCRDKDKKPYLAVDKDLRQKANERAKALGFKSINEMIHHILQVKSEQTKNNKKGAVS